ncbi:TetR/AcrR family transcriptional regulator [Bradyrhizobium viridifuturi]|nr:TetR family transcriptional regulator [Bradyrhizobium viridifuturi]
MYLAIAMGFLEVPMRRQSAVQKPEISTRDRILNAAVLRFSRRSYEETGLRDIAADVGIDVSYVHRCFGSKKRLFAEAVEAAIRPVHLPTSGTGEVACSLAQQVFARDATRSHGNIGPLDIVVRSFASEDAARVVRQFILKDFINPLAEKLDQPAASRATLIAAFLAGVRIFRNVLRIAPLFKAERSELEGLIANVIEEMMKVDPVAQGHRRLTG